MEMKKRIVYDIDGVAHDANVISDTNGPYIRCEYKVQVDVYNPIYDQNKLCTCGHPYHRHFDPDEHNEARGCKYCGCCYFVPKEP